MPPGKLSNCKFVQWSNQSVPLVNPEGVINPRQGMKREARNPCSHGVKRENPEGVTEHRQAVERSASGLCPPNPPCGVRTPAPHVVNGKNPDGVTDFGVCRPFSQGFRFAPYPAWGLSSLRDCGLLWHVKQGLRAARSTACLGSVVPSGLPCRWGTPFPSGRGWG